MLLNNREYFIFVKKGEYMVGKLMHALKKGDDIEVLGHAATKFEAYQLLEALTGQRPLMSRRAGRPVRCVETGETFPSAAAACARYGISAPLMSMHLARKDSYTSCKGLHFKYTEDNEDTEL